MVRELIDPRKFVLNYSGESTVYPDLIPAIQLARSTGAFVELVSALAAAPESMLGPLSESGLNRLTVSVHATDPDLYNEIYRYSSVETLRARLERFVALSNAVPDGPRVDVAFVAMDRNLAQLGPVASLAASLDLRDVFIFPVMRRDEIPAQFPIELSRNGAHRPEFRERVRLAVDRARADYPEIRFTICNESFASNETSLGEVPRPYAGVLPPGAYIHTCEQNPWETAHVLSNGDVVACEVLDQIPLGNLNEQSIAEIGTGKKFLNVQSPLAKKLANDWRFTWIYTYYSGYPSGWPDLINKCGNWHYTGSDPNPFNHWFNNDKSCYATRPSYTLRVVPDRFPDIRNPAEPQLNLAIEKTLRFGERYSAQIRAESFNITNTPIYAGPDTSFTSSRFGMIPLGQQNFPRLVQLAAKFIF